MLAFLFATALLGSQGIDEGDRRAWDKQQHTNLVKEFRSFHALSLNGDYGPELQARIIDVLKPYGVKWAAQSKSIPLIYLTYSKRPDSQLPTGYVLGTIMVELRTELDKFEPGKSRRVIQHALGMAPVSFVAKSGMAADHQAEQLLRPFLKRLGTLWKESRSLKMTYR